MTDDALVATLSRVAHAVGDAFRGGVVDYRARGDRPGQYALDLVTDAVAVELLVAAGFGVLSEESGRHHPDRALTVVVDPIDGSTNASRGIPWFNTSLAVLDRDGLRAGLVLNQASGECYTATRGGGAWRDGELIHVAAPVSLGRALVAVNGHAAQPIGSAQYRAFGAAALDLCLVAQGSVDAYLDVSADTPDRSAHGSWDYLAGMCIVVEAGGVIEDVFGRDLIVADHDARRSPVAASSAALLGELVSGRSAL